MKVIRRPCWADPASTWLAAWVVASLGLSLGFGRSVRAEPPQPLIACVFPAGGQRGTTFEATVYGTNLQAAGAVRISGPGVIGLVLPGAKPDSLKIAVTIARDAELGERDLRRGYARRRLESLSLHH